ncbi:hypothetical protein AMTR_s00150p00078820, partial [Amborella trichopoda]
MGNQRERIPNAIPFGTTPIQMASSLRPPFSSYDKIKNPDSSVNAANAISTNV